MNLQSRSITSPVFIFQQCLQSITLSILYVRALKICVRWAFKQSGSLLLQQRKTRVAELLCIWKLQYSNKYPSTSSCFFITFVYYVTGCRSILPFPSYLGTSCFFHVSLFHQFSLPFCFLSLSPERIRSS